MGANFVDTIAFFDGITKKIQEMDTYLWLHDIHHFCGIATKASHARRSLPKNTRYFAVHVLRRQELLEAVTAWTFLAESRHLIPSIYGTLYNRGLNK